MKNLCTTLLLMAIVVSNIIAQGNLVFFEDLQQGTPSWIIIDSSNATPVDTSFSRGWKRQLRPGSATDYCAASTSYFQPTATADVWMIFGPIAVETQVELFWDAKANIRSFPDGYEVYVATAPTIADMLAAGPIYKEPTATDHWATRSIKITNPDLENTDIYLGFRNNSRDEDVLLVDNIALYDTTELMADLQILEDSTIGRFERSIAYGHGMASCAGTVIRNSGSAATDGKLTIEVKDNNGLAILVKEVDIPFLQPGETFRTPKFTFSPTDTNTYTTTYRLSADDRASNNGQEKKLVVNNTYTGFDLSNRVEPLRLDPAVIAKVGVVFPFNRPDTVSSIRVYIDNSANTMSNVFLNGGVYEPNANGTYNDNARIAGTDTVRIDPDFVGFLNLPILGVGLPVDNTDEYLFAVEKPQFIFLELGRSDNNPLSTDRNFMLEEVNPGGIFSSGESQSADGNFAIEIVTKERCQLEVEVTFVQPQLFQFEDGRADSMVDGSIQFDVVTGTAPFTNIEYDGNTAAKDGASFAVGTPIGLSGTPPNTGFSEERNYQITDAQGCVFNYSISLDAQVIIVEGSVGLSPQRILNISVWPNPTSDGLSIASEGKAYEVTLANLAGQIVAHEHLNAKESLQVSHLQKGMYLGRVAIGAKHYQFQFLKQ